MDPEVKPSIRDRLEDRRRFSSKSPDYDERRRSGKQPKYNMDVNLLQCIICKNELSPPVCQCKNGHLACQFCCKTRTRGKCLKCFQPIGRTRNKAVEEMITSLQSPCKHVGCKRMLPFAFRKQHELYEYEFMLLRCPFPDCRFTSFLRKFPPHLEDKHKDARVIREEERLRFNLDPRDEFVLLMSRAELFLLHQEQGALGKMIYLSSCSRSSRYSVEVVLGSEFERERKSFKMETMTSDARACSRDFLLLPKQSGSAHHATARCTVVIPAMD